MPAPNVYIVIVNYLNWQDTRDCLFSLLEGQHDHFTVVIVDNASGNSSLEELAATLGSTAIPTSHRHFTAAEWRKCDLSLHETDRVWLIQNERNTGFAAANNLVIGRLTGEDAHIWMLNPDMTVRPDTLAELVRNAAALPANSVIGATVLAATGNHELFFYGGGMVNFWTATVRMNRSRKRAGALDYISGGSLFTHASSFLHVGLLPEEYFLYWEETDWCYRARQLGYGLSTCIDAVCYDKISTVIGKGFLADYYYSRNGLRFVARYRRNNIPVALFFMAMRWSKRVITGNWQRACGVYRGTIDFLNRRMNEAK